MRSYDWYLLPPQERSEMLAEHGRMARAFPQVQANTVSGSALGDYEWLLAFEADELTPILDLMRHLRGAEARRHTRHELPFLTGRRRPLDDAVAGLPCGEEEPEVTEDHRAGQAVAVQIEPQPLRAPPQGEAVR